jgi:CRISPR-associated protein Cas6
MKVDVTFPLKFRIGTEIPRDHGYLLYSAICKIVPELHGTGIAKIKLIRGKHDGDFVRLNSSSKLSIRIDESDLNLLTVLVNQTIQLGNSIVSLGIPFGEKLKGSDCLFVPWTIIHLSQKNKQGSFKESFLNSLKFKIPSNVNIKLLRQRVTTMKGSRLIGYDLFLENLTEEQSLKLQSLGVGSCTSMGCGIPEIPKRNYDKQ